MGTEKRDEIDQLIDTALAGYSDVEPLAGLEDRVLERVRLAGARRRWRAWWSWAIPAVAAAALVLVLVAMHRPPADRVVRQIPRAADAPPVALSQASRELPKRAGPVGPARTGRSAAHEHAHRNQVPPKRDQFPLPAPLTAEERALLQVARHHPNEWQPMGELQPIEIAPIEIAPLRIDEDR